MPYIPTEDWRQLLKLLLAQRLEMNAVESALRNAGILSAAQIQEIRKQAASTSAAWSSNETDDILALLRIHSSPQATMLVPPLPDDEKK